MSEEAPLSEGQQRRIEATLDRIRSGLDKYPDDATDEPSHVYLPEAACDDEE